MGICPRVIVSLFLYMKVENVKGKDMPNVRGSRQCDIWGRITVCNLTFKYREIIYILLDCGVLPLFQVP